MYKLDDIVTGTGGSLDPEYPAFSPNVVAVGGTSLFLNADNSYQLETAWGYTSAAQSGQGKVAPRGKSRWRSRRPASTEKLH